MLSLDPCSVVRAPLAFSPYVGREFMCNVLLLLALVDGSGLAPELRRPKNVAWYFVLSPWKTWRTLSLLEITKFQLLSKFGVAVQPLSLSSTYRPARASGQVVACTFLLTDAILPAQLFVV